MTRFVSNSMLNKLIKYICRERPINQTKYPKPAKSFVHFRIVIQSYFFDILRIVGHVPFRTLSTFSLISTIH